MWGSAPLSSGEYGAWDMTARPVRVARYAWSSAVFRSCTWRPGTDADESGWVAALVPDVELYEAYVEEVNRADEVGGGFGGVGAVEG